MRVTFNSQYQDAAAAIEKASQQFIEAQRRVSTGRRISRVSDDPTAAATSLAERSAIGQVDQYTRSADSVASRLAVVDTVLSGVVEKLTAAQRTATAARGSTLTANQRAALAQELAGVRDALVDDMNSTLHGRYLFGGAAVTTKPYTVTPPATAPGYVGSNNEVRADISNERSVIIALDGEAITRGGDPQDVFATLDQLIADVASGDSDGVGAGLDALQRAFDRATAAQSRVGNDLEAIDVQKVRLQQLKLSGSERLDKLEAVDMAEAITELQHADAAYRASLGAIGTSSRTSLMDYLK
jgi:flagellar hook-associated protein 3 FlgL